MDCSWITEYPEKKSKIESINIGSVFKENNFPEFMIDPVISKSWLALYWFEEHKVTVQKQLLKTGDDERFINIILHELGHSTSKYTNRWNRIMANCSFNFKQAKMLEEQIAETLSLIFRFTLFDTSRGSNVTQFNDYMFCHKSSYKIPWGEIDNAISSLVVNSELDKALTWSEVVRKYIVRHSIAEVTEGVFNGRC